MSTFDPVRTSAELNQTFEQGQTFESVRENRWQTEGGFFRRFLRLPHGWRYRSERRRMEDAVVNAQAEDNEEELEEVMARRRARRRASTDTQNYHADVARSEAKRRIEIRATDVFRKADAIVLAKVNDAIELMAVDTDARVKRVTEVMRSEAGAEIATFAASNMVRVFEQTVKNIHAMALGLDVDIDNFSPRSVEL